MSTRKIYVSNIVCGGSFYFYICSSGERLLVFKAFISLFRGAAPLTCISNLHLIMIQSVSGYSVCIRKV